MITRGFLKVVLGRLGQNAGNIVINEEEQIKHEGGEEGAEDALGGNALGGVNDPGTGFARFVDGGLPVPGGDDVDAFDSVEVCSGEEAQSSNNNDNNGHIVTGQKSPNLPRKQSPSLREMKPPAHAKRQHANHQGRIMRRPIPLVTCIPQMKRLHQIPNTLEDERTGNEKLKDLGRERTNVPYEIHDASDCRQKVQNGRPYAQPPKERPIVRIKLFGQSVTRTQQNSHWSRNTQKRQRLSPNNRINNPDHPRAQQRLRRGDIPPRLTIHQLRENQCRDQLDHEGEEDGVDYGEHRAGLAPVGFVVGGAGGEVLAYAGEQFEELFWFSIRL
mmetsp:Transcript_42134/g.61796  ORF Transcript_42134/g.61796 Transcript_42134/m.61796 type:complete len:330 (+) Transcript_42134:1394-2383(+)